MTPVWHPHKRGKSERAATSAALPCKLGRPLLAPAPPHRYFLEQIGAGDLRPHRPQPSRRWFSAAAIRSKRMWRVVRLLLRLSVRSERLTERWLAASLISVSMPIDIAGCLYFAAKPVLSRYSIGRCPFLNAPAGSFPKTSPVEWNRVMLTRGTLWRGRWRQALLSGSMGRRVLALFSPTMAETMCSFTSAPSNARDFPAWLKVKGFLTNSKLTPGAVKAAQKTCGSDNVCWRSTSELPTLKATSFRRRCS
jgi:hypothetical protein